MNQDVGWLDISVDQPLQEQLFVACTELANETENLLIWNVFGVIDKVL